MKFNSKTLKVAVREWLSDSVASESKYGPISNWDTSQVTDMGNLFCNSNFNQPIGDWDVTNVTEMRNMFSNSTFNQPIGGWDVSNVTDMGNMFSNSAFNQWIGDWDVTNVTDMSNMFSNSAFNQWIGDWDISNVSDMNSMFSNNQNFNQNISKWEVSSFTDISEMFYGAKKVKSFCWPGGVVVQIHSSDGLRVAVKEWLSDRAASEAKYGHISNWDTSQVTDMSRLFNNATDFNQPLNDWDVSNVTDMSLMFYQARAFNQPLNDWDVSNVTDMNHLFRRATELKQPLNDWDVSNYSDTTLQLDEQLPQEIVISCESHDFFYENSDGDKCSFIAYLLICLYSCDDDTEIEIRDLIFEKVGEVILTFKEKNREPHIITDLPEIIDEDQRYHMREIEGEIYSVKEAVQFINSLKTVKFDSLPKADTDDFVSSEYKDWCIDNFNITYPIKDEDEQESEKVDDNIPKQSKIIHDPSDENQEYLFDDWAKEIISEEIEEDPIWYDNQDNGKTLTMFLNFTNAQFSEHPRINLLGYMADNSYSDFVKNYEKCLKGEFIMPVELKKHLKVIKYNIGLRNAFQQDDDCLILDIECEVTFEIKTKYKEAITAIDKFQQENHDLRWNLSIYWCHN